MIYFSDFGSRPWVPTDLGATLKAWYDADQQAESNGANVSTLVDRSGNGFNGTLESGDVGPFLRYSNVNGKKALEAGAADGDKNGMRFSSTLLSGASAATMLMIVKCYADPTSSPADEAAVSKFSTASPLNTHFYTDGNIYENFGSTTRRSVNPPTAWDQWRIYGVTSASNDWKLWWDGTAILTDTTNTVNTGSSTRRLFTFTNGAPSNRWRGHLAELLFCDTALGTTDRQKLEGYLAHKFGLAANLPGGHPYISSPP